MLLIGLESSLSFAQDAMKVSNTHVESLSYDGNTLYVGGSGPNNYSSIQSAVNDANPGDTVFVYNGTYYETVYIDKNDITLLGEDKNITIIDGIIT